MRTVHGAHRGSGWKGVAGGGGAGGFCSLLLTPWINMQKMRLSLSLPSAPVQGWVTALFRAAWEAVPTLRLGSRARVGRVNARKGENYCRGFQSGCRPVSELSSVFTVHLARSLAHCRRLVQTKRKRVLFCFFWHLPSCITSPHLPPAPYPHYLTPFYYRHSPRYLKTAKTDSSSAVRFFAIDLSLSLFGCVSLSLLLKDPATS